MDHLTEMLLAEWAEHRMAKPYTDGDDYAVHIDHLRIAADQWATTDAALRLIIGTRLATEAIEEWEAGRPLDFDVQQVREAVESRTRQMGYLMSHRETDAALAVIVPAVTQQIRTLHQPVTTRIYEDRDCQDGMCDEGHHDSLSGACYCPSYLLTICRKCSSSAADEDVIRHPCPTVRVLDEIESAVKAGER